MITVYGKIDSLKKIRHILDQRGITDFNSIREIDQFLSSYNNVVYNLKKDARKEVEQELNSLNKRKNDLANKLNADIERVELENTIRFEMLNRRIHKLQSYKNKSFFIQIFNFIKIRYTRQQILKNKERISNQIALVNNKNNSLVSLINNQLQSHSLNSNAIIENKISTELDRLYLIKQVLEEINPLVAGAIGEHKVAKELERLSSYGILINDFKINVDPPVYYKKEKNNIHSIQLDHLLLTKAGIFIIETKNWSKKSIENRDLRSPVDQVNRSSYALYRMINNTTTIHLKSHHWGKKEIPIRNIIVLINNKPNISFFLLKLRR